MVSINFQFYFGYLFAYILATLSCKRCYHANKNKIGSRRVPYKSPILVIVYTKRSSKHIVPKRTSGLMLTKKLDTKARLTEISVNDMIVLKYISMTTS